MKVTEKQRNSKSCFICGLDNESGVGAPFYALEDGSCATIFQFKFQHQSYPERVHGGIISALLDEVMGRAVWIKDPETYGVTTTLNVTFRRPAKYGVPLKARGYITFQSALGFTAKGELFDSEDNLLAESTAKYLKLSADKVTKGVDANAEMCYYRPDDIKDIEFPPIKTK